MGFFDTANQKLAELQQRTGDFMSVQKLNSQRRALKRELERLYTVIGETCCRMHAEGGDPEALNAMFAQVADIKEKITALDVQADALNRVIRCPGCGEVISKDLNFCPRCGHKLITEPAAAEITEDEPTVIMEFAAAKSGEPAETAAEEPVEPAEADAPATEE